MSISGEKSGGASTLPPPELNPLLNPLLAQNMGRWAQVYFTSPPEKREQAVQELVRELEGENSKDAPRVVAPPIPIEEKSIGRVAPTAELAPAVQPTLIRCHACGKKNLTSQKFCGMCGTPLGEESAAAAMFDVRPSAANPAADMRQDYAGAVVQGHQEDPSEPREPIAHPQISRDHEAFVPRLDRNELSLFQGGNDSVYQDRENREYYDDEAPIFSTPPSSGSSGILVGLLLVVALAAAVYFGWPKLKSALENLRTQPATSSAPSSDNSPNQTNPASNESATAPAVDNRPDGASYAPKSPMVNAASKERDDSAPSLPQGVSRPPKAAPSKASATIGGGEELAMAQGYLNGTAGRSRNSAEAAQWLWKAIAKHNPEATLLLADLYLKGDGVSKNCDQARVLLDSAALQGVKSAGDRLRHIQAFGCQ